MIFATKSFFQGVDTRGEALQYVILDRLPMSADFNSPRSQKLKESFGKSWFLECYLPPAINLLLQAIGRLIRSKHDTGTFVLLDCRINTERYGSMFHRSIFDHYGVKSTVKSKVPDAHHTKKESKCNSLRTSSHFNAPGRCVGSKSVLASITR